MESRASGPDGDWAAGLDEHVLAGAGHFSRGLDLGAGPAALAGISVPSAEAAGARSTERSAGDAQESALLKEVPRELQPVVYCAEYDVSFLGVEKMCALQTSAVPRGRSGLGIEKKVPAGRFRHPFDSTKWRRVVEFLVRKGRIQRAQVVRPEPATEADLLRVHTREYLDSLKCSRQVAAIAELPFLALLPNAVLQWRLLRPFQFQVGGSVLAGKLALERGWALNIGGGLHHACSNGGGGFCIYADITLLVSFARSKLGIERVMIVDLDAHQGNGHERDFLNRTGATFILDMYNRDIYPQDHKAKEAIDIRVELQTGTQTEPYLDKLQESLERAFTEFSPQLVVYNAGTDILDGDPLGRLAVSAQGVIRRDEMVFMAARGAAVPIVMLTSGGYQRNNAEIIADSIGNLADRGLISLHAEDTSQVMDANTEVKSEQ